MTYFVDLPKPGRYIFVPSSSPISPMRWFVEVSPLGRSQVPPERHCVDAAQWQQALSQVRKHTGHDDALRNFSIEVLDDGVRAVDPTARLRYHLEKAPASEPLTLGSAAGPVEAAPKPAELAVPAPTPVSVPVASEKKAVAQTMVFGSSDAANSTSASPQKSLARPSYASPSPSIVPVVSVRPPSPVVAEGPSAKRSATLPFTVVAKRSEEPTSSSPLTYREVAYAIAAGTTEDQAEEFVRACFEGIKQELASTAPGKLITLAAFDHTFDKKPQRPPLVTLTWKDWKNTEPELRFPARSGSSMPPPSLGLPPKITSMPPAGFAFAPIPLAQPALPVPSVLAEFAAPVAIRREPSSSHVAVEVPAAAVSKGSAAFPARADLAKAEAKPVVRVRKPTPGGMADIVADVFEVMHDLHFSRDVHEGADFVLALVQEKLQSEYAIVQLYDINRREFVVSRAAGPNAEATVGGRTSEREPLIAEAMRRRVPFVIDPAQDGRVRGGRWMALGAEPHAVMVVGVVQGGRFLGMIEVGCKPGKTYQKAHLDGIAYIAEAFAEFLASRGLVFDDDKPGG